MKKALLILLVYFLGGEQDVGTQAAVYQGYYGMPNSYFRNSRNLPHEVNPQSMNVSSNGTIVTGGVVLTGLKTGGDSDTTDTSDTTEKVSFTDTSDTNSTIDDYDEGLERFDADGEEADYDDVYPNAYKINSAICIFRGAIYNHHATFFYDDYECTCQEEGRVNCIQVGPGKEECVAGGNKYENRNKWLEADKECVCWYGKAFCHLSGTQCRYRGKYLIMHEHYKHNPKKEVICTVYGEVVHNKKPRVPGTVPSPLPYDDSDTIDSEDDEDDNEGYAYRIGNHTYIKSAPYVPYFPPPQLSGYPQYFPTLQYDQNILRFQPPFVPQSSYNGGQTLHNPVPYFNPPNLYPESYGLAAHHAGILQYNQYQPSLQYPKPAIPVAASSYSSNSLILPSHIIPQYPHTHPLSSTSYQSIVKQFPQQVKPQNLSPNYAPQPTVNLYSPRVQASTEYPLQQSVPSINKPLQYVQVVHSEPAHVTLGCPLEYARLDSFCVHISDKRLDWNTANSYCRSQGGQLAYVSDLKENNALRSYMHHKGLTYGWLGFADLDGYGYYFYGKHRTPFYIHNLGFNHNLYHNLKPGDELHESSGHCIAFGTGGDYHWYVTRCQAHFPAICRVQYGKILSSVDEDDNDGDSEIEPHQDDAPISTEIRLENLEK